MQACWASDVARDATTYVIVTSHTTARNKYGAGWALFLVVAGVRDRVITCMRAGAREIALGAQGTTGLGWMQDCLSTRARKVVNDDIHARRAMPCVTQLLTNVLPTSQRLSTSDHAFVRLAVGITPTGTADLVASMAPTGLEFVADHLATPCGITGAVLGSADLFVTSPANTSNSHRQVTRWTRANVA